MAPVRIMAETLTSGSSRSGSRYTTMPFSRTTRSTSGTVIVTGSNVIVRGSPRGAVCAKPGETFKTNASAKNM